jgi:AraC-like DNA-binding protein
VFPFSDIRRRSSPQKVQATHRYGFHFLVVRQGQVHSFGTKLDWEGWLVFFRAEFLPTDPDVHADLLTRNMLDKMPDHQTIGEADFRMIADAITTMAADQRASTKNMKLTHTLLRHQLCALILRLQLLNEWPVTDARHHNPALRRFERFRELLETNFATWHQIAPYAQALGCTQKSLNRATQDAVGLSAKSTIARRIALEAKRLLAHTNRPIFLIAEDLGFDEATNFSKFFRNNAGQSPAEFRAIHRV